MTLIIAWRTDNGLIVAADSKIGSASRTGYGTLTEVGPKIFEIPLKAKKGGLENFPTKHFPSFGYAFAGSTLAAQSIHAVAGTYLQNLTSFDVEQGPSLNSVAALYKRCAQYIFDEQKSWNSSSANFHAVVFGYCDRECSYQLHELKVVNGKVTQEKFIPELGGLIYFGSGQDKLTDILDNPQQLGKEPIHPSELLQLIIDDGSEPTVGGTVQYAMSSGEGTFLRPLMRSDKNGQMTISILGIDLNTLGMVENFVIGHHAIVFPSKKTNIDS